MYTVIGTVRSRAFRVLWALEELGLTYTHVSAGARSEEARKYNPLGKVPVMLDGDAVLTDSMAIVTYLADKHGGLTAAAGTTDRAQQDAMTFWLVDELDAALWLTAKHKFILPEDRRVPAVIETTKVEFARNIAHLGRSIRGEFLMGDSITVPDILAVHCLNWAISAKLPVEDDAVNAYAKRLRARDAFKAVRELDTA